MSLSVLNLDLLSRALADPAAQACDTCRVLSLGYPDILATPEQLREFLGAEAARRLRFRDDSASVLRWHNIEGSFPVADAESVFLAMGYALDTMDIVEARGGEIIQDLNVPVPDSLDELYAAVIDGGTLEHCFNIAEAARNVARMTAVGGVVMHGNPLNMYNHGFYNLSPTWYHDFYRANGFELEAAMTVNGPYDAPVTGHLPLLERFRGLPENTVQLVIARRRERRELRWPIQSKYVANPMLRA